MCSRSGLRPAQAGLDPGHEQKRFSTADRRGELCVVASPDGRRGSLRIHQDALLYSAMLGRGKHVVHELREGRSAWLHLVEGEVTLGDLVLSSGDGAGLTAERAVSLTAREETEILLIDLGAEAPAIQRHRRCSMNDSRDSVPDSRRSRLRATIAVIELELARLPGDVTKDNGATLADSLRASVDDLSGSWRSARARVPECPACYRVGMRAATVCGHCWTTLSPRRTRCRGVTMRQLRAIDTDADADVASGKLTFARDTGFHDEVKRRVLAYFERTGLSQQDSPRMHLKTAVLLLWFGASYALLVFAATSVWQGALLSASLALAMAGIGFGIQHDANHGAYSSRAAVNRRHGDDARHAGRQLVPLARPAQPFSSHLHEHRRRGRRHQLRPLRAAVAGAAALPPAPPPAILLVGAVLVPVPEVELRRRFQERDAGLG